MFVWVGGSTTTADDVLTVQCTTGDAGRYKRIFDGALHSLWFAVGDYVANDTTALNTFFAHASAGLPVWIDDGLYKITAALAAITGNLLKIGGDGRGAVLKYVNAGATTATLMTIGDGTAYNRASVGGFTIESATTMNGGYGIWFRKYAHVDFDVWCGDEYSEGWELNNAVWFDACVVTNLHTSHFYGANRGILWSGTVGVPGTCFELHCMNAHVKGNNRTGYGIHIAGGCGGFNGENLTQLLNNIGLKVDTSISGTSNDQIFMGDADLDSNAAAGVEFDNALAGNLFYSQDDAWIASSAPGVGLKITIWLNGKVRVGGGRIYNHVSDAVLIADNTIDFRDTDDSIIETNGGYGINASVAVAIRSSGTLQNNSAGNYHVNVTPTDSNGFSSRTLDFYAEGT